MRILEPVQAALKSAQLLRNRFLSVLLSLLDLWLWLGRTTPLPEELFLGGLADADQQGHFQRMNHASKVCYGKKLHLFGLWSNICSPSIHSFLVLLEVPVKWKRKEFWWSRIHINVHNYFHCKFIHPKIKICCLDPVWSVLWVISVGPSAWSWTSRHAIKHLLEEKSKVLWGQPLAESHSSHSTQTTAAWLCSNRWSEHTEDDIQTALLRPSWLSLRRLGLIATAAASFIKEETKNN